MCGWPLHCSESNDNKGISILQPLDMMADFFEAVDVFFQLSVVQKLDTLTVHIVARDMLLQVFLEELDSIVHKLYASLWLFSELDINIDSGSAS